MRCVLLGNMLRKLGASVEFITRNLPGNLVAFLSEQGFPCHVLVTEDNWSQEQDAALTERILQNDKTRVDWIIVDHYQLDQTWESRVARFADRIMVIDDLANRKHVCHLLLDQNYYLQPDKRYQGLVPDECETYLGLRYFMLRPEFFAVRKRLQPRNEINRLVIFFGGSDPTGETEKAVEAAGLFFQSGQVDVIVGKSNPQAERIRTLCNDRGFSFHCQTPAIADLFANADLSLGAGGVALWERCYLGLPSLTTIVADNQRGSVYDAVASGAVWSMGWHESVNVGTYVEALALALQSPERIVHLSERSFLLTKDIWHGSGIHPVVQAMLGQMNGG